MLMLKSPQAAFFFVKHCFHLLNCPRVPAKNSAFVNAALADEGKHVYSSVDWTEVEQTSVYGLSMWTKTERASENQVWL